MRICKDCLVRHNWKPSHKPEHGDCEICWDRNLDVYDIVRPEKIEEPESSVLNHPAFGAAAQFNEVGKSLDKAELLYYHKLCNDLSIYHRGWRASEIDSVLTSKLRQINITVNGVQDWKATYKRRLRAKQSIQAVQERIGG